MRLLQEDWAEQELRDVSAHFHFVTTSDCAICQNFVNSCCKGCQRAEWKKNLDRNAAKQEEFDATIRDFEVTFESAPEGTQLRKASDKVRMPQWVQVLKERPQTSTMHLGVSWPFGTVERVEVWRPKAADGRTHRHGKPMVTTSADGVGSSRLNQNL